MLSAVGAEAARYALDGAEVVILGDFNCRAAEAKRHWHVPALLARSSCPVTIRGLPTGSGVEWSMTAKHKVET